jgi:hypothetical protein
MTSLGFAPHAGVVDLDLQAANGEEVRRAVSDGC